MILNYNLHNPTLSASKCNSTIAKADELKSAFLHDPLSTGKRGNAIVMCVRPSVCVTKSDRRCGRTLGRRTFVLGSP